MRCEENTAGFLALFMLVASGSVLADERPVSNPVPDGIGICFFCK